jgi:diguanylate cyclase
LSSIAADNYLTIGFGTSVQRPDVNGGQLSMTSKSLEKQTEDFDEVVSIAKKALQYVGQFQTPPTPKVYEVWYRFVEAQHEALLAELSYAVDEAKSVSQSQLEDLHDQFCLAEAAEQNHDIGQLLLRETYGLSDVIEQQLSAGQDFRVSIHRTTGALGEPGLTLEDVASCAAGIVASNKRMQAELELAKEQLYASQTQINALCENLSKTVKMMMTDPLTGVGNRRCFDALVNSGCDGQSTDDSVTALLLIDLDGFKLVNDTHGHSVGDALLKFVANAIQSMREEASVARYGGDEFGVFLKAVDASEAYQIAEAIRQRLAKERFQYRRDDQIIEAVTASIGLAILRRDDTPDSWFERADKLLYRAKQDGRNCVRAERRGAT